MGHFRSTVAGLLAFLWLACMREERFGGNRLSQPATNQHRHRWFVKEESAERSRRPGHSLVRCSGSDAPRLSLIDLHARLRDACPGMGLGRDYGFGRWVLVVITLGQVGFVD